MAKADELRLNDPNRLAGLEISERKPIILGGDPAGSANKVLLTRREHIEVVRYWNRVIRDLQRGQKKE